MTDKKNDPNYGVVRGLVPQDLVRRFKIYCLDNSVDNSEGLENILTSYFTQLESQNVTLTSSSLKQDKHLVNAGETIAEIVQQNYYGLLSDGKITPDNLQKIAQGEEPSKADIYRIASFLHVEALELLALRDRLFPQKKKMNNGAT